jgi:hypothetical protein
MEIGWPWRVNRRIDGDLTSTSVVLNPAGEGARCLGAEGTRGLPSGRGDRQSPGMTSCLLSVRDPDVCHVRATQPESIPDIAGWPRHRPRCLGAEGRSGVRGARAFPSVDARSGATCRCATRGVGDARDRPRRRPRALVSRCGSHRRPDAPELCLEPTQSCRGLRHGPADPSILDSPRSCPWHPGTDLFKKQ